MLRSCFRDLTVLVGAGQTERRERDEISILKFCINSRLILLFVMYKSALCLIIVCESLMKLIKVYQVLLLILL